MISVQKIKEEIQFSILRISEKRYKAEAEVETLKVDLTKKETEIEQLKKQLKEMSQENSDLKQKVALYEGGGARPALKPQAGGVNTLSIGSNSTPPRRIMQGSLGNSIPSKINEYDFQTDLDVRDDLSEIASPQKNFKKAQQQVVDEDDFWYGAGEQKQGQQSPSNADMWISGADKSLAGGRQANTKLPSQVQQLKRVAQNQERVTEDMGFYGVSVKSSNNPIFKKGK